MNYNIKYFSIAKLSDFDKESPFIQELFNDQSIKLEISKETTKVLRKLATLDMKANERQKLNYKKGSFFTKVDENNFAYIVLTSIDYPERTAYEMIQDLQEKVADSIDMDQKLFQLTIKNEMKILSSKYDDKNSVDKISNAQAGVDGVILQMQDNIKKMTDNQVNMENLNLATNKLASQGQQFQQNSKTIEDIMKWRNRKLNIILGLVALSLILYILIPIIRK